MAKVKTTSAYRKAFQQLNDRQREAVETIDGTLLVLAGPGTGKTQLLATRIGYILEQTDTAPHNILCLTYTNSGVNAMRDRLRKLIGPEGFRVHIHTFHSFCRNVIQNNALYFGAREFELISDLEKQEVFATILSKLPADHPLKKGYAPNNDHFHRPLEHLFKLMKTEGWTLPKIAAKAAEYLKDLPNRADFYFKRATKTGNKKGDFRQEAYDDEVRKMNQLVAAAKLLPLYNTILDKRSRYDYEDQISWVIEAFKERNNLLRRYQEQYLYILVDEFQDTNGAQFELLNQLADFWEAPNLFVVGDDDQAIFEFQGARLKNMVDFYHQYLPAIQVINLADNYRSSPAILAASGGLIHLNELRLLNVFEGLEVTKSLTAKGPEKDNVHQPEVYEFAEPLHETAWLVEAIKTRIASGVPAEEIAVIYRNHKHADDLLLSLQNEEIPFSTKRPENILEGIAIRQILQVLEYFAQESKRPESGEGLVFQLLHASFWEIPVTMLHEVAIKKRQLEEPITWKALLQNDALLTEWLGDAAIIFRKVGDHLMALLSDWFRVPPRIFMQLLLNTTGILGHFLAQKNHAYWVSVFSTFITEIENFNRREPSAGNDELLDYFEKCRSSNIAVPLNLANQPKKGVQLLTAHGAKGLEFRTVFMYQTTEKIWNSNRSNNGKFSFPDTITYATTENELESNRRLFYVAFTRAKQELIISYSVHASAKKGEQPSRFVEELFAVAPSITTNRLPVDIPAVIDLQLQSIALPKTIPTPGPEHPELLDELIANFELSASSLNAYLKCPLEFYYHYLLNLPGLPSENSGYGTAIHGALQRYWERYKLMREPKRPIPTEDLVAFFELEMRAVRHRFKPDNYSEFLERGKTYLPLFLEKYLPIWEMDRDFQLEYTLGNAAINNIPITGRVDRLDYLKYDHVRIVDYKTSPFRSSDFSPVSSRNRYGGKYWRQLVFYKLLVDHGSLKILQVESGRIEFVTPDKNGDFPLQELKVKREDTEALVAIITEIWERILQRDFFNGCDKPNCKWCQLHRDRDLPLHTVSPDVEAMDE